MTLEGAAVLRVSRGDSLLGFAQVRQVRGKEQPITCLVALDPALTLRDIDVLIYREAYGGEVAYEPWRKQFRGRTPRDTLEVGRTVRGISGATISVNAVTLGIRQTLADFARWRLAGLL
ncbi:MAG: FMN-binding protein [Gemmatimonadales bacterium]